MSSLVRTFRYLTPEYADAAVKCVADTFGTQDDPFTRSFGLTRHHWAAMSEGFIRRAARAKVPLSIVAYNRTTGEVDGLMINEDWVQQPPAEYHALGSDWKPTRGIFKELHTRFHGTQEAPFMPNEALHCLYFTCVRPSARGQGVMKGLWSQTIDAAKDNNYSSVIAEAGSEPVTQVLTEYLGFREVSAVDYAMHEHEGKKVYAHLPQGSATAYRALRLLKRRVNSDLYV